jgi:hypothetical protein
MTYQMRRSSHSKFVSMQLLFSASLDDETFLRNREYPEIAILETEILSYMRVEWIKETYPSAHMTATGPHSCKLGNVEPEL